MEQVEISRRELSQRLDSLANQPAWRSQQERAQYYENAAIAVIERYVRLKQLSPLVASNIDPDGTPSFSKLTFDSINYVADIELATERALADLPELQSAWFDIAMGNPVAPGLRNDVLQRCGRVYAARRLEPWKYWHPTRRPQ